MVEEKRSCGAGANDDGLGIYRRNVVLARALRKSYPRLLSSTFYFSINYNYWKKQKKLF